MILSIMDDESADYQKTSFARNLFKKDSTRFKRYIESTTVHGVVHIFIGKSIVRKLFWLILILGSTTGCLYNCIDRIRLLASKPTATTITIDRRQDIIFPAVTICNLNMLNRDYLEALNLGHLVQRALVGEEESFCTNELNNIPHLPNITYQEFFLLGKEKLADFIVDCEYLGKNCSVDMATFVPTFTRLGVCYTFNSGFGGRKIHTTNGTGARLGLRLILNVSQSQYAASPNLDAGVKIAVHRQSEPPEPDDQGIGIPTGRNAFINVRQLNIIDKTGRSCISKEEVSDLNFLQEDFNYSSSACANDCFYTQIANACSCVLSEEYTPDREPFKAHPLCTIRDMCCVLAQQTIAISCRCLPSCNSTFYELTNSYSTFPATPFARDSLENAGDDLLMANIFYESLSIEEQTTLFSYNMVSLLSDIGGQLGLFLGISIISLLEFLFWVIDETKDRCFGVSEKRLKDILCREKAKKYLESNDSLTTGKDQKYYGMNSDRH